MYCKDEGPRRAERIREHVDFLRKLQHLLRASPSIQCRRCEYSYTVQEIEAPIPAWKAAMSSEPERKPAGYTLTVEGQTACERCGSRSYKVIVDHRNVWR